MGLPSSSHRTLPVGLFAVVDETGEQASILSLTDDDVEPLVSMYRDYPPEDRSMGLPQVDE